MADPDMEHHPSIGPEYPSPQRAGSDYIQPLGKLTRNHDIRRQGEGIESYGKFGAQHMKDGTMRKDKY